MSRISKMTRAAAFCMVVAVVSGTWADTWTDSAGYTWTYRINGNTAEINNGYSTAISPRPYGAVTVPSALGGKPVTSIGDYAFKYCSGLTSVTIPDSVTSIGDYAFEDCSGLTSVTIPDSITSIGREVFRDCSELANVVIGSGVTSIGDSAFEYCRKLKSVEFKGNAPPYCYHSVFYGVASGCEVIVPRNSTGWSVGEGELWHGLVLRYASNIKWTISNGELRAVELNGETDIRIPSSVTRIGENAFRYCYDLASVIIPDSVISIGDRPFEGCYVLKNVTIGNGVTSIGREMLSNCSSLTNVTIGSSVTSIGDYAFEDCSGLTSVTIPNSVTSIGERAFDYCRGLKSVTIGNRVTNIGNYAFLTCSSLTSITIPASVTSIGKGAFGECFGLTSVLFLGNLPDCGSDAFKAVAMNVNVGHGCCVAYVDSSVASPQDGDIWNNLTVRKIPLPQDANLLSRVTFTITDYGELTHVALNGATLVLIPGSVTKINSYAFDDCSDLTCILFPNSVQRIDHGAFRDCSSLANIVLPVSMARIEDAMFEGCNKLTSIVIPDSLTSIGSDAFSGCNSLTNVTIGKSVTSIGNRAFNNCSSLTSVTIPDSVTSIGSDAFSGCNSLTNATIGKSVTSIGYRAFYGCSGLTSVHISDLSAWCKISFGGYDANPLCSAHNLYLNGTKVTDLVIPDSVASIGAYAFYGCSGLASVTFLGNAPAVDSYTFYGVNASCVALVSPKSTGWGVGVGEKWNGLMLQYWPEVLTEISSDAAVGEVMSKFADKGLVAQVSTVADYNAFRAWVNGNNLYQPAVVDNKYSWLSYALGADALIGKEIMSNDVRIVAFEATDEDGGAMGSSRPTFAFEVAIDGVNIGGGSVAVETLKENLKRVLGIEGAVTLSQGSFSSDNIDITFDAPVDGKARFIVSPPVDAGNSFFMRVKVKHD